MGCVPPSGDRQQGFLQSVRRITEKHGTVLIFDEVMTGFRLARGGAQELYGIRPDMTTLGKIIGGGLPVGAFGGNREIMDVVAPIGPVYQAGTLSGNPLAVTAGLTTLRLLKSLNPYAQLERATSELVKGMTNAAGDASVKTVSNRIGSMFTTYFTDSPVYDWTSANRSNRNLFAMFFHAMLEEGKFEAAFISVMHTDDIIDRTIASAHKAFKKIAPYSE
jgi:glutamate-1-semialdehyde 2,1-aminomutase